MTTSATLTVMNVVKEDEGNFTCVVTNVVGSVTSSAAQLTVLSKFVYYIIITIVQSYTGKYHEFVAVCIVTSVQHE